MATLLNFIKCCDFSVQLECKNTKNKQLKCERPWVNLPYLTLNVLQCDYCAFSKCEDDALTLYCWALHHYNTHLSEKKKRKETLSSVLLLIEFTYGKHIGTARVEVHCPITLSIHEVIHCDSPFHILFILCVLRVPELLENTDRQQHHCQHHNIHCGLFTESTGKQIYLCDSGIHFYFRTEMIGGCTIFIRLLYECRFLEILYSYSWTANICLCHAVGVHQWLLLVLLREECDWCTRPTKLLQGHWSGQTGLQHTHWVHTGQSVSSKCHSVIVRELLGILIWAFCLFTLVFAWNLTL